MGELLPNSILVKDAVLKQLVNTLPVVTGLTTKKEMSGFYKDYRGIVVAGASKPIPQLGVKRDLSRRISVWEYRKGWTARYSDWS